MKKIKTHLAFFLAFLTACTSHPIRENKQLSFKNVDTAQLPQKHEGPFQYSEVIYTTSKLPLEDFFSGLISGRFNEAVSDIDVSYHPSNIDNDLVRRLVKDGVVPVFIQIQNTSKAPVFFSVENFILKDKNSLLMPLKKMELPVSFSRFSSENAVDNAVNITESVLIVVAVIFVVGAAGAFGGNINDGGGGSGSDFFSVKSTTVVTHVNYDNLLLEDRFIQPNETVQGLLFFQTENHKPPTKPKLQFKLQH